MLAVIGGIYGAYVQLITSNDYALAFYLKSSDKIIENNSKLSDLKLFFNGKEVTSLYITKVQLKNSGRRALTKEYIYDPVTIVNSLPGNILKVSSNSELATLKDESLFLGWDLFNPGDVIDLAIFSTGPVKVTLSHKIREIQNIEFIDEISNPPAEKRVKSISKWWLALIVLSILISVDAIWLIRWDAKGSAVLGTIKGLSKCEMVDKEKFLSILRSDYDDYYKSAFLFIKPDDLIEHVSSQLSSESIISGIELEVARKAALSGIMNGNLYTIRSHNLFVGPLLFGVCLFRIAIALIA